MKKIAVIILTLVLVSSLLGCSAPSSGSSGSSGSTGSSGSSGSSDTKTVSAYGMSLDVPKDWGELVDTTSEGFALFANEATGMSIQSDGFSISFMQTVVDTYITFDELTEFAQGDGRVVVINNNNVYRETVSSSNNTGVILMPDTGKTVNTAVMIVVDKNQYDESKELLESIINSLVLK